MAMLKRCVLWFAPCLLLLACSVSDAAGQTAAEPPANEDCLACHGDASLKRANTTSVAVNAKTLESSKHGSMTCVDCHEDLAKQQEYPHPEKLAKVSCATCHSDTQAKYASSVHARVRATGQTLAATCTDCHGAHDIEGADNPSSTINNLNLPRTCAKCHGNPEIVSRAGIQMGNAVVQYRDSIHGRALERAGLVVAPTCVTCHGSHDIRRKTEPASPIFRMNVPATCGKCHAGVERAFNESIHATALKAGNANAPHCASCHTAHGIVQTESEAWQLSAVEQCGTCHREALASYRDTLHGQVTRLGFTPVAKCVNCHQSHQVFHTADPRSTVSPAKLVGTCQTCHPAANAKFAQYQPHANPHDRKRLPALFYTARFMNGLLLGVFGFFGLHSALWFIREHVGDSRSSQDAADV
jgi:nitrate/TMAO reductase-like tetraheme cytochrome c subunit